MKYASQVNIAMIVVALIAVGYAVSETVLQPPLTPIAVQTGGTAMPNMSGQPEGGGGGSDGELSGGDMPKRQRAIPRPSAGLASGRSAASSGSRPARGPAGAPPRTRPGGKAQFQRSAPSTKGARVVATRRESPPPDDASARGTTPAGNDEPLVILRDRNAERRAAEGQRRSPGRSRSAPARNTSDDGTRRSNRQPPPPPARSSNR